MFEELEFLARSSNLASLVARFPGFKDNWNESKETFEPRFREYLDSQIAELDN